TGDGMLTALQLVSIMKSSKQPLSVLAAEMEKYPQYLENVHVTNKNMITENDKVSEEIRKVEQDMNGEGRMLVRPSGTEPLVRVMAEAQTEELCHEYVDRVVKVIQQEMGM